MWFVDRAELAGTERDVQLPASRTTRLLLAADGVPVSLTDITLTPGVEEVYGYPDRTEVAYCISGAAVVVDLDTGARRDVRPGVLWVAPPGSRFSFLATEPTRLVCAFHPPLGGHETGLAADAGAVGAPVAEGGSRSASATARGPVAVRDAGPDEGPTVVGLGLANGMFTPAEADDFAALLADRPAGAVVLLAERDGVVVGAACSAPEPFADRVHNLLFIATAPGDHGAGAGTALLGAVEGRLRDAGPDVARLLLVDTSSGDGYERARRFYLGRGFVEEARIRGYYGPDEAKVTYRKDLTA